MNKLPKKQRIKTASQNYGVGKSTLWKLIAEKKLSVTRPSPRVTLLDTDELDRYFNSNYDEVKGA